jgi:hypothetical protein
MTSGTWLHDHESLAALVFIILSLGLTAGLAWLERRFFHRKPSPAYRQESPPFLKFMLKMALYYSTIKRKIFARPPALSPEQSPQTTPEASSSTTRSR